MNDLLKIRTLTEKFFDGDTTPEEEQVLYNFYWQDSIPEDLRPNRELFRDLAALASLAPARRAVLPHRRRWWVAAAVVALFIVGGTALYRYQAEDECVAYIYGERVTDREVVLSPAGAYAQTGLKINELFEGRIIPQEKMVETRVRGKTLAKYQLTYYRSVRFNATEEEAERLLKMVEADGKGHFATGGDQTRKTMHGKEHSITFKTQVGKQGDKNCFLCYQALWRGNNPERQVTVIYMEGPVRSLGQLEELLKN